MWFVLGVGAFVGIVWGLAALLDYQDGIIPDLPKKGVALFGGGILCWILLLALYVI